MPRPRGTVAAVSIRGRLVSAVLRLRILSAVVAAAIALTPTACVTNPPLDDSAGGAPPAPATAATDAAVDRGPEAAGAADGEVPAGDAAAGDPDATRPPQLAAVQPTIDVDAGIITVNFLVSAEPRQLWALVDEPRAPDDPSPAEPPPTLPRAPTPLPSPDSASLFATLQPQPVAAVRTAAGIWNVSAAGIVAGRRYRLQLWYARPTADAGGYLSPGDAELSLSVDPGPFVVTLGRPAANTATIDPQPFLVWYQHQPRYQVAIALTPNPPQAAESPQSPDDPLPAPRWLSAEGRATVASGGTDTAENAESADTAESAGTREPAEPGAGSERADPALGRPAAVEFEPAVLPVDHRAAWFVRAVSAGGIVGPWQRGGELFVDSTTPPDGVFPRYGEQSAEADPLLAWEALHGAVEYEVETQAGAEVATVRFDVAAGRFGRTVALGTPGSWRVRAWNRHAAATEWSDWYLFTAGTLSIEMQTVIPAGAGALYVRGSNRHDLDEAPEHAVELTTAFDIARSPLTNTQVTWLANWLIRRNELQVRGDRVLTTTAAETVVIGLGALDYGSQFGLRASGALIEPVPGRENHPAIGISWEGAVVLSNALNRLYGYPSSADAQDATFDPAAVGYRLPTEAEWEYAANGGAAVGAGTVVLPDGRVAVASRQTPWNGPVTPQNTNFFRSMDPFEDTLALHTAAGGPTTPVGYFNGSRRGGFATADNSGPLRLYDMLGNVWQWCYDYYAYDTYLLVAPVAVDPVAQSAEAAVDLFTGLAIDERVVRGAAWNSPADAARITNRGKFFQTGTSYSIGFRPVLVRNAELPRELVVPGDG